MWWNYEKTSFLAVGANSTGRAFFYSFFRAA
jgi:hypothetical protein